MKPAIRRISQSLAALYSLTGLLGFAKVAQAQVTPDNTQGSQTTVTPNGDEFDITGGVEAGDNLIHSFDQFSLDSDQSAIFNVDANIQNILSRVTGGNLSQINGLIEVLGGTGSTNLFLMNPAGIVFGQGASLNVPGSFTATTATSIGLDSGWFNATGPIDASQLAGTPNNYFAFDTSEPGAIISSADLEVENGNLTLIGGTVASEGTLAAPNGQITLATVPGESIVRLTQPGMVLSLDIERPAYSGSDPIALTDIPALITGGSVGNATTLAVNNGQVVLSGSGIQINNGDVVATETITASAGIDINSNRSITIDDDPDPSNDSQVMLDTSNSDENSAGSISLFAQRDIVTGELKANDNGDGSAGDVTLYVSEQGNITTGDIRTINQSDGDAGDVTISTDDGDIDIKNIFAQNHAPISRPGGSSSVILSTATGSINIEGNIRVKNDGVNQQNPDVTHGTVEYYNPKPPASNSNIDPNNSSSYNPNIIQPNITQPNGVEPEKLENHFTPATPPQDLITENLPPNPPPINNEEPEPPPINNEEPESPPINNEEPESPPINNEEPEPPPINNEEPESPPINNEEPESPPITELPPEQDPSVVVEEPSPPTQLPVEEPSPEEESPVIVIDKPTPEPQPEPEPPVAENPPETEPTSEADLGDKPSDNTTNTAGNSDSSDNSGAIADNGDNDTQAANSDTENSSQTYSRAYSRLSSTNTNNDDEEDEENCSADDPSCEEGDVAESNTESNNSDSGNNNSASTTYSRQPALSNTTRTSGTDIADNNSVSNGSPTYSRRPTQPSSDAIATTENTTANPANTDNANSNTQSDSSSEPTNTNAGNSNIANNSANANNQPYSRVPSSDSENPTTPSTDSGNNNSADDNAVNTPNTDSPNDTTRNSNSNTTDDNSNGNSDVATNNPADDSGTNTVENSNETSDTASEDNANTETSEENGDETYSRNPNPDTPDNSDMVNNGGSNPTDSGDNSGIANGNSNTPESSGQDTTTANNGNGTPSETSQQQASNQEESSLSKETDNVSDRVDQLEAAFTQEFQTYLQQQFVTKRLNLQEITEQTRDIEQVTGLKTAVIYVSFVPQSLNSEANACQAESQPAMDRRFGYTSPGSSSCSPEDNQQLELVLITADGQAIQRRVPNAIRAKVLAETQKFQRTLSDRRNLGSTNYLDSAQQLYQWLIEPLADDLEARQIQGLMFAMDSGLRSLPIAALHDGDNFLIENYSVNLIPSFSLIQARNPDIRSRQVLAMGASKFSDLPNLTFVPLELSTITESLWKGKAFLNENFTFQNLQEQISENEFGIIHLATHAEFKPGNPDNSYIQLWNRKLRLNELKNLGLSDSAVDLLVLSACRTALGNEEAELGFAGSALQAGVDSTLATLWYVSDEGALGVTTEFYRQLRQLPIKSEALRRAQLAMIRGEVSIANGQLNYGDKSITLPPEMAELVKTKNLNFSHPYYWAPFTLIGNPQ
ncbi:MAG: CHAT domain-containing protein [Coleofasciculus sp. C1-SOL-03]|uniref:CHAT domain-containing protein n=1 Tax=Coleofasciculus sp. C1-SOL-03 TaxID=3069522 RepID=UPI0032FB4E46